MIHVVGLLEITAECDDKRRIFYSALNVYRHDTSDVNRINMVQNVLIIKHVCVRQSLTMISARQKNLWMLEQKTQNYIGEC